jgi:hypothetical protein
MTLVAWSATPRSCRTPEQVVAEAKVAEVGPNASALGLTFLATGLSIASAADVSWQGCMVHVQPRQYGPFLATENGVGFIPGDKRIFIREGPLPGSEPETDHPEIPGGRFVSSTLLGIGDQRAGLWIQANGQSLIARYRPGKPESLDSLMSSSLPVMGVFYLGAPDSPGGNFQFWQRVSANTYRFVIVGWTEQGTR